MYLSHQLMRGLSNERMTPAQQRAADEQLGRIAAAILRSAQRIRTRTRHGGRLAAPAPSLAHFSKYEPPIARECVCAQVGLDESVGAR